MPHSVHSSLGCRPGVCPCLVPDIFGNNALDRATDRLTGEIIGLARTVASNDCFLSLFAVRSADWSASGGASDSTRGPPGWSALT
ncbi:MAG TPA: hypothetical protein VHT02_08225, partial [Methylocella sp.]|nr:hypothetical protein [Methylocella sp.]